LARKWQWVDFLEALAFVRDYRPRAVDSFADCRNFGPRQQTRSAATRAIPTVFVELGHDENVTSTNRSRLTCPSLRRRRRFPFSSSCTTTRAINRAPAELKSLRSIRREGAQDTSTLLRPRSTSSGVADKPVEQTLTKDGQDRRFGPLPESAAAHPCSCATAAPAPLEIVKRLLEPQPPSSRLRSWKHCSKRATLANPKTGLAPFIHHRSSCVRVAARPSPHRHMPAVRVHIAGIGAFSQHFRPYLAVVRRPTWPVPPVHDVTSDTASCTHAESRSVSRSWTLSLTAWHRSSTK